MLYLPWGSGPMRAGLRLGNESPTLGPSSFDVGGGRLVIADDLQERVAVFQGGRLAREIPIGRGAFAHVAAAKGGALFVVRSAGQGLEVSRVSSTDATPSRPALDRGIVSEVEPSGDGVAARILPEDAWVTYSMRGSSTVRGGSLAAGMPTADGAELVRIGRDHSLRLGTVRGDRVVSAFEIRSELELGEVALVRPAQGRGAVVVVRVAWAGPSPSDRFEVLRLSEAGRLTSFAVSSDDFAAGPPLARFKLDEQGNLYQLRTSSDGMRIVRFDLGVAS
jgi:hypothetical protein